MCELNSELVSVGHDILWWSPVRWPITLSRTNTSRSAGRGYHGEWFPAKLNRSQYAGTTAKKTYVLGEVTREGVCMTSMGRSMFQSIAFCFQYLSA